MWGDLACMGMESRGRRAYLSLLHVPRERRRTGAAEGTTLCRCRLFMPNLEKPSVCNRGTCFLPANIQLPMWIYAAHMRLEWNRCFHVVLGQH